LVQKSSTSRTKRSGRRSHLQARKPAPTALTQLPRVATFVAPLTIRYEIDAQSRFTVYGLDAARWANVISLAGANQVQPLFSTLKIQSVAVYGTANVSNNFGGSVGLVFADDATSTLGRMVNTPVVSFSTSPFTSGCSYVKKRPPPGSIQHGWFNPNVVGSQPLFTIDCRDSQLTYVDVSFVGCIRNDAVDAGAAAPQAQWIWAVSGPPSLALNGTFVAYPLCSAIAAVTLVHMYPYAY
jgi:hypothetical protein